MMPRNIPVSSSLATGLLLVTLAAAYRVPPAAVTKDPSPEEATFFETKIRPIFANSCISCHGPTLQLGGLRLDSREAFDKGGDSGAAIVGSDPDKSRLVLAVRQTGPLKMPQGGKLKPEEVAALEAWVKMGSPWPATAAKAPDRKPLWSLQPVANPTIPKVKDAAWVRNDIDAFVLSKLESNHLTPAAEADRRTLIRRVTYDLTGLPPRAADVDAFLADKSKDAYEKVVDRLLASPRYGERWARHWLDVARYSDTKGYVFDEDRNYYNAYTYRDWVINAFNRNLPYDQFIVQQLAADRLPEVQNGDDKTPLAALGYLTVGRRFSNSQPDIIDDRIDVTMRGLQAFTVACARCHDHKFDPIPTQDYYSLYAVFNSSAEKTAPISVKAIRDPWQEYDDHRNSIESGIRELIVGQVKRLRELNKSPDGVSAEVKGTLQGLNENSVPEGQPLEKLAKAFEPKEKDRLTGLQRDLDSLKKAAPPTPEFAMALTDVAKPHDGVVFKRGNPGNPGPPAPRRFLLALSKPGVERDLWTTDSGRLELARSIASKSNPLTARVFVNRVWQDHFGAGIVRTPSDFGNQGEKPTDPALLDFLATRFMGSGWDIKKLHRLMVTSATYRQSSDVPAAKVNADPDNRLMSRMNRRRLDLEQMRDTLLLDAGHLDTSQVGGKSVDLWAEPVVPRRSVYGFVERQNLPGIFRTFDFASPDSTNARRFLTTVPQQALFFMNSRFVVDLARSVTDRPEISGAGSDAVKVQRLYQRLFARLPDADELAIGLAYLKGPAVSAPVGPWRYGFGSAGSVPSFTPFGSFAENSYRVGAAFPDPKLGYVTLNPQGGHPGHDEGHAAIRRWIAPADLTVGIQGSFRHRQAEGDGVIGQIVSSRAGVLGEFKAHKSNAKTDVATVSVKKGDAIDFVVLPGPTDAYDSFTWTVKISTLDGSQSWDSVGGFEPPPGPPLSRLTLYAQALMMTNEFMFVD